MESCHICGQEAVGQGYVEGASIALCEKCSRHSKRFELFDAYKPAPRAPKPKEKEEAELVVGFGQRIRQAREQQGLSREQLGKKLLISEPDLRAFEEERRKPIPHVAKKIEYTLQITLIESKIAEEVHRQQSKPPAPHQGLTLGDVIKIKKK